jgi:hypothetical protein
MIPMKHSTIFRNRWFACLWAAGILWFAYDVAGSAPQASDPSNAEAQASPLTDATGAEVTEQQAEELKKALDSI